MLRYSKKIYNTLTSKNKKSIYKLIEQVELGEKIIQKGSIDDFGYLLDEAWQYKREISGNISNFKIDEIYKEAKKCGALGGNYWELVVEDLCCFTLKKIKKISLKK